ncbi:hypothetical protein FRC00_011023, partial [Tulasnella sp. 408]
MLSAAARYSCHHYNYYHHEDHYHIADYYVEEYNDNHHHIEVQLHYEQDDHVDNLYELRRYPVRCHYGYGVQALRTKIVLDFIFAVGKNGAGKYATITEALADTSSNIIYIYPGNYTEQVVISRSGIKIYGQTSNKLAYSSNTVTISRYMSAATAGSNDASGTVRVLATGVSLYNLNIENTFGKGAQAIALSVQAGTFGCYACQLRGYQDTLLASRDTQFYGKCLITGATDFIFGLYGSIWITGGTIQTVASGYITASGRASDDANWYVIDKTTVTGTGTSYLGRPWRQVILFWGLIFTSNPILNGRNYARVVFQNSNLGSIIPAAGWTQWSTATPNTDHILFAEYNNTG